MHALMCCYMRRLRWVPMWFRANGENAQTLATVARSIVNVRVRYFVLAITLAQVMTSHLRRPLQRRPKKNPHRCR